MWGQPGKDSRAGRARTPARPSSQVFSALLFNSSYYYEVLAGASGDPDEAPKRLYFSVIPPSLAPTLQAIDNQSHLHRSPQPCRRLPLLPLSSRRSPPPLVRPQRNTRMRSPKPVHKSKGKCALTLDHEYDSHEKMVREIVTQCRPMLADENWSVVQSVQPTGAAIGPVYFNHTAYQTTSISKFFEEASIVVSREMDKVQLSFWVFHDMALGATLTGGICWYAQVFFDTRAAIRRELIDENKTDLKSSMKVDGNDKTTGTQCRAVSRPYHHQTRRGC